MPTEEQLVKTCVNLLKKKNMNVRLLEIGVGWKTHIKAIIQCSKEDKEEFLMNGGHRFPIDIFAVAMGYNPVGGECNSEAKFVKFKTGA